MLALAEGIFSRELKRETQGLPDSAPLLLVLVLAVQHTHMHAIHAVVQECAP